MMASAAYWIGSAADQIVITPSGEAGSIGVLAVHTEFSGADAAAGIKSTIIKAGAHKAEGNDIEPLAPEAEAYMQKRVDAYYADFVKGVARNRGTKVTVARSEDWGQGRELGARDALAVGMVDRIATIEETIERMGGPAQQVQPLTAAFACSDGSHRHATSAEARDCDLEREAVERQKQAFRFRRERAERTLAL